MTKEQIIDDAIKEMADYSLSQKTILSQTLDRYTTSLTTRIEEQSKEIEELKKEIRRYQNRYEQSEGDKMLGY